MNEQKLEELIATFAYPSTPDLVAGVRQKLAKPLKQRNYPTYRRLAWVMALLFILFVISMAVPQVRAAVLRIFRVGAVTIFVPEEPVETAVPTLTPVGQVTPTTPPETTRAQDVLLAPAGAITMDELQAQTTRTLYIPEAWGMPDRIYYQTNNWPGVIIFVWLEPGSDNKARLSLYQIFQADFVYKGADSVEVITLQGERAFWIEGGHWLQLQDGTRQPWLFVDGGVLVWWSREAGITFRLESGLSLDEAKEIAESLIPLPKEE